MLGCCDIVRRCVGIRSLSLFVGIFILCACDSTPPYKPDGKLHWIMINVNTGKSQAEANLILFPKGEIYLLDAGDGDNNLAPYLLKRGISKIDKVIISHAHADHYNGISSILRNAISVDNFYVNLPDTKICDREIPWGCNLPHITETIELVRASGSTVHSANAGDVLFDKEGILLKVLYAYDGISTPVKETDINDTSLVTLLTNGHTRVLFTGDLNELIGGYLADSASDIEADILKVPHHGADSLAPNLFFGSVSPKIAVIPAPGHLWNSDRCKRARTYFKDQDIPVYVNGIDGHILVHFEENAYTVETEF